MTAPVLRVGCPMWAHRPWVGRFFPRGIRPGDELAHYARWCNAVEGNTTFYAVPPPSTVARWAEQAPAAFRFVFKLPRRITHERRLRQAGDDLSAFVAALEPLGERVGPVSIQLPPSFGPSGLGVLAQFLRMLPAGWSWAVEVRHPAFFDGGSAHRSLDHLLRRSAADRVVLDTRPLFAAAPSTAAAENEWRTKPRLPVVTEVVGRHPVVRLIGQNDADGTAQGWRPWLPLVVEWLQQGREPYVFVHQPDNLVSPALARRFHAEVAERVVGLVALPDPADDRPGGQGTLW